MDSTFLNGLPPLKRLRFMQQQQQQQQHSASSPLPAKKRKESRNTEFLPHSPPPQSLPPSYSLPAKKRVCALQPHLPSNDAVSPFDLNVEYNPSLIEEEPTNETTPLEPSPPHCSENASVDEEDDGIVCSVCQSTDGDPSDPIVLCDGCDLMVHASCYGNPLAKGVPEGDWFCEQCVVLGREGVGEKGFCCCLCPVKEGAMKPTKDARWAHLVCAVLVPEVFFEDPEGREGIDCSKVPRTRWTERCYVCDTLNGCAVVCSEPKCCLAFHVTCGLREDLCIEYMQGKKKGATVVAGFCKTHTQLWEKQQQSGKYKIVAREDKK